ncbi:hypothetical protein BHM03_00056807 [Ensete ventricosum]|nr:hypothetical protein BHM03_00056807 [Ensete ventricosum]
MAPNRETQLEAESPLRQVTKAHAASPTTAPARSQIRSCDLVQTSPDFDTLSSDSADSLREQVCQVHQWLDEVQKELFLEGLEQLERLILLTLGFLKLLL